MKFINKYTFQIIEIESDKASELNVPSFAVLGTEIVPELKYTKGMRLSGKEIHNTCEFDVCTEILEMNMEEKAAVDLAELKQKTNADFLYFRYRTRLKLTDYEANPSYFMLLKDRATIHPDIEERNIKDDAGIVWSLCYYNDYSKPEQEYQIHQLEAFGLIIEENQYYVPKTETFPLWI